MEDYNKLNAFDSAFKTDELSLQEWLQMANVARYFDNGL